MKVKLFEKIIYEYSLDVDIEREGEKVRAVIKYNQYDGYDVHFTDPTGHPIDKPEWADKMEEDNEDPLGYQLEELLSND